MPLVIAAATSGQTTIQATDAVTATITLPSATDTLVGKITPSFTTTIGVGNATPSASGAGITFPATQSASTNANTLDDYEEGTWTPNQGTGLTVVGAFASNGKYTKVGNQVTVVGYVSGATSITLASMGDICTNLPFSQAATQDPYGVAATLSTAGASGSSRVLSLALGASSALAISLNIKFTVTYFV
jgi:hypothetical protein